MLYNEVKDSLFHKEMMQQISELQIEYETNKKEQEILALNQEKQLQSAQLLHQKTVKNNLIIGIILFILFVGAVFFNYWQNLKTKEIIALKNEEINHQKIIELEKNQRLYALDAMISGQDVERKRIAQDLHDGLGALLSTVQMHFSSIENEIKRIHRLDIYDTANKLLDEACQEVRKISHNMMPGTLLKFGLVPAIQDICDKIQNTNQIKIEFNTMNVDDMRLEEHVEITIFRLIQEGLNNIVKHAGATDVIIQLLKDDNELHLVIEDNGIGFDVDTAWENGGMGVRNLESRIQYLNGKLEIRSYIGEGTTLTIYIPV
jgi:signal transduction histidine kinase